MKATETTCLTIDGSIFRHQKLARDAFERASDRTLNRWAWVITTCGNRCINPDHLITTTPTHIKYPPGVCVYCGMPSGTRDHLAPRPFTGDSRRSILVPTVPACADCNRRINDLPDPNVNVRRRRAQGSIRRSKQAILEAPDRTDRDLNQYGYNLQTHLRTMRTQKQVTLSRLQWPEDPLYDVRAFQTSGIADPIGLGLIDDPFAIATRSTHEP